YRYNIIYKYTFRHYLYFFISRTFLGSELMVHAMELRIMNKHVLKKIYSTDINNVFLQHGVMYMVSLDSESRKYFSPKKDGKGKFRVVTSSQLEADHFTQLGGYDENQVIVCGLPKYDRNILYPDADKIVIMLTWRVWEYNQATTDFESTPYYKMLQRIVSGINDTYREHLVILPHPLFYKSAMNCEFELKKYMQFNVKYDEILRQTCVLITDYSSIAYDAFYRGSRVIFYWEELESCLEKYGKNTKLMLNKDNVFGDICYSTKDIEQVIDDNYHLEQKKMYQERYNQIVEFHDGKNTKRLIARLKSEKII
ncbi:MAG: CDP-glycerol glycerophosphotransferase family protein, partial [Erysipelotrichales bacterium]|nr:CDP-glycerol glycerophosphotransferase family protein [Erysipelotrichales bacterium]